MLVGTAVGTCAGRYSSGYTCGYMAFVVLVGTGEAVGVLVSMAVVRTVDSSYTGR